MGKDYHVIINECLVFFLLDLLQLLCQLFRGRPEHTDADEGQQKGDDGTGKGQHDM